MGCGMIKPDRQNMFGDPWIAKFLPAAIRQDHEIEFHSDGHDSPGLGEVGRIDGVNWAAQQNQRARIETILGGEHGNASAMTMG